MEPERTFSYAVTSPDPASAAPVDPLETGTLAPPGRWDGRAHVLEAVLSVSTAVLAVLLAGHPLYRPVLAVLVLWVAFVYVLPAFPGRIHAPQRFELVTRAMLVLGCLTAATVVGVVQLSSIPDAALAMITASLTSGLARTLRWNFGSPVRVLVAGDQDEVRELLLRWSRDRHVEAVGACVLGHQVDRQGLSRALGVPVLREIGEVPGAVHDLGADSVMVVPGPSLGPGDVRRLTWALERTGTPLGVAGPLHTFAPHRVRAGTLGGGLVMHVVHSHRSVLLRACKSVVDRVVGAFLLVLAAPVIMALCLAIRIDSPGGGSFFKQQRIGLDGKPFTMYKLRTMQADAEALKVPLQRLCAGQMLFKLRDDPRVTRVGRWLRRYSLDELPQLINVAKGDMSLVGPRPPLPDEVARYDDESRRRLAVRPGITGLWQVSGRSDLSWEESLALDLHYVDNWRFSDDLVIALRTVEAVFRTRGAY